MIFAQQSASYEAVFDIGISGLVGVIEVMVVDNQGATVTASSAADCVELAPGSGLYAFTRTAPAVNGQYSVIASTDGTYDVGTEAVEDLLVSSTGLGVPPVDLDSAFGPCFAWTTGQLVAECCNAEDVGSSFAEYDDAIAVASEVLYEMSGRRFSGLCQQTARPCSTRGGLCGIQTLSRGYVVRWDHGWDQVPSCGCEPLESVPLSGYPVSEIVEVKIDGVVVDQSVYALYAFRDLVRVDGGVWPACQHLGRADTEDGTFSVTYTYGIDPSHTGQLAARDLACQIFRSCNPAAAAGNCELPPGVVRVTRQGVTFDRQSFGAAAYEKRTRTWRSGIPTVDLFLSAYNPHGLRRRPSFRGPDSPRYARVI